MSEQPGPDDDTDLVSGDTDSVSADPPFSPEAHAKAQAERRAGDDPDEEY